MMTRWTKRIVIVALSAVGLGLLILMVSALTGCTMETITPPPVIPTLEILQENLGWVQVKISNITTDCTLRWGDFENSYGICPVVSGQELYEHFYQDPCHDRIQGAEPWEYTISLQDARGLILEEKTIMILPTVDCHLSLIEVDGRSITVRCFGRWGILYTLAWGDRFGETVESTGEDFLTYEYSKAGIYMVKFGEIHAPPRTWFSVTIE